DGSRLLDQCGPTATPAHRVRVAAAIGPDDSLHSRLAPLSLSLKPSLSSCMARRSVVRWRLLGEIPTSRTSFGSLPLAVLAAFRKGAEPAGLVVGFALYVVSGVGPRSALRRKCGE